MRFYGLAEHARDQGHFVEVSPLLGDRYLKGRFANTLFAERFALLGLARRMKVMMSARRFDLTYVHIELFPKTPYGFERLFFPEGTPYVLDFDDAWFHSYDSHPNRVWRAVLQGKFESLIAGASGVVVGSRYLEDYACRFHDNVLLVPTSVDMQAFPKDPSTKSDDVFTVGWIGSPATTPHLSDVAQTITDFCRRVGGRLVVIGAGDTLFEDDTIVRKPWSELEEVSDIAEFDVGIMPLPDTPFARGKCAFKLVQYMACRKPVIASPVGENVHVVNDSACGLLATTHAEWRRALEVLHGNPSLRAEMGRRGREAVEERYSLQVNSGRVLAFLQECSRKSRSTTGRERCVD